MPEKKALRAPRPIRESTFLDDPSLYPEFKALVRKLPNLHAFRCGFHRHRTAVLVMLMAVCMALSGVPRPPSGAAPAEWIAFCSSALGASRLKDHFQGFASSLAAMGVVAVLSIVVYPLHSFMTPAKAAAASSGQPFSLRLVTLWLPAAAVWSFAVWAKNHCVWGLASGLWFALYCACVTLKITSFTATVCAPAEGMAATPTSNGKPIAVAAAAAAAAASPASSGGLSAHALTFREYLFFQFQAPSLVCEVRLMKESARLPIRPLRAASEFFHAVLTFLTAHCMVGAVLAPSLRVFITGLCPEWVEGAGAGWAELGAGDGGGGWPSWEAGSGLLEEEGGKVTLLAFLWMMTTVSSCVHFLVFYAFWHCVCLGMAELCGFPDRHLYGCWWLIFDEPRDFLRMWSVPVHRWLSSCVHWPMLEAAARRSGANASVDDVALPKSDGKAGAKPAAAGWLPAILATFVVSGIYHEAIVYVAMRGTCWPFNTFLLVVAGGLVTTWDFFFPLREAANGHALAGEEGGSGGGGGGATAAAGGVQGVGVKMVSPYGARGMLSSVMFSVLVQLSAFISDCAAWLWWRHVLMEK